MLFIFELMKSVIKARKLTIFFVAILFIVCSSVFITYIEPDVFTSPFLGFWWVMTTITTTGYGDLVPETTAGRLFAIFLYTFGVGLIGVVIGKIVEGFGIYRKLKEEGQLSYKGKDHYVVVGWSQKSKNTIQELQLSNPDVNVVVIDSTTKAPFTPSSRLFYIQGDVTNIDTYEKANLSEAKAILIFSPDGTMDDTAADGMTLLVASSIKSFMSQEKEKNVYTLVEIKKENHIANFKHLEVDEFVLAGEALSDLMARSAMFQGSSTLFMKLLSRKYDVSLWNIPKRDKWETYRDAFDDLKFEGAHLIADDENFNIMKKLDEKLPVHANLFIICEEEVYKHIMELVQEKSS
ncbi:voltage-gated potassium channel [Alteribacillus persepolensis]|uniref:Voltage-gated potassium channel n=1 Tax=Alteribacillus persepolensis TaxID=568899 RepID=A0A1G7Z482_9BACI|nr:potassium channel family protein [Alteribacillus persepolensis]SDH03405.1 voltage-gated potassium channel [Alteribacillus persepolensis]